MLYNRLGSTGLVVSRIGYGNMVNFQPEDEEVNTQLIKLAFESGINFFDTAEIYENGKAEQQLGRSLKALNIPREKVVITTKVIANLAAGGNAVNRTITLNRKHIIEAVNTSLQNLQLDYVDVVYAHQWDPNTPIEEVCRGFNQVIEDGKAFYWAVSNWNAPQIQQAYNFCDKHGLIRPVAEQGEYHMLERKKFEVDLVPLYEKFGLGTTIYSPLCGGLLTGKYLEGIPEESRFGKDNGWMTKDRAKNRFYTKFVSQERVVAGLKDFAKLAAELGCTPAQLALAWVLRNEDVNVAIIGARNVQQLQDTLKSLEVLKKFDAELDARLEKVFENKPAAEWDYRTMVAVKSRR